MWATLIATSVLGLIGVVTTAEVKNLPSYLTACKKDAPDFDACCLASARAGLPHIVDGDTTYGIPSFKPLKIEKMELNTSTLSVSINDASLYGLDKSEIHDFKFDLKNQKILIKFQSPLIEIFGKYNIEGQILVLPLKGNGNINITAENLVVEYLIDYKLIKKGDNEYLTVDDGELSFTISNGSAFLDNLFEGNKQLGESTNTVINKEWKTIVEELSPSIKSAIKTIARSIVNGVSSRVPYKNLFL